MSAGHNGLAALAADIRAAHAEIRRGAETLAERALAAGRMLVEAKAAVPHGEWSDWLDHNTRLSARTARRYMQLVRSGVKSATVADLGIRGAARSLVLARRSAPTVKAWVWPESCNRFHVLVFDSARSDLVTTQRAVPVEWVDRSLIEAGCSPRDLKLANHCTADDPHVAELRDFAICLSNCDDVLTGGAA